MNEAAAGRGLAAEPELWGGLRLAGLEFALPLTVLREVVPCAELLRLPNVADIVVGCIDLRGVLVPVLDLRSSLVLPAAERPPHLVLVLCIEGRLLGLSVDEVTGTFRAGVAEFRALRAAPDATNLMLGSLRRDRTGGIVTALEPSAIAALPGVPVAEDRERRSALLAAAADHRPTSDAGAESLLLLRCGVLRFAIDALQVQSTLWGPKVRHSALTSELCRGVILHRGQLVPALDLTGVADFGITTAPGPRHGFVLELATGMVVFLVDEVTEIARVRTDEVLPLPAFAFAGTDLLRGVCAIGGGGTDAADHLVLDAGRLLDHPTVRALAQLNTAPDAADNAAPRTSGNHGRQDAATTTATGRTVATFDLDRHYAVPLEQLIEVLPISAAQPTFGPDNMLRRMLLSRGRSIPILDLARVLGQTATQPGCVLVVQTTTGQVGFAIPTLKSIEPAAWERAMPDSVRSGTNEAWDPDQPRRMARVGTGPAECVVEVLDLESLAGRLLARGAGLPAATASTRDLAPV